MKLFGKEITVIVDKADKPKKKTFTYITPDGKEVVVEGTVKRRFFNKKTALIAGGVAAAAVGGAVALDKLHGSESGNDDYTEVPDDVGDVDPGEVDVE